MEIDEDTDALDLEISKRAALCDEFARFRERAVQSQQSLVHSPEYARLNTLMTDDEALTEAAVARSGEEKFERRDLLNALVTIKTVKRARAYVRRYARWLPRTTDVVKSDEKSDEYFLTVAQENLGYMTGEGIPLVIRQWWAKNVGVRHPGAPALGDRDMDPYELFQAGYAFARHSRDAEKGP